MFWRLIAESLRTFSVTTLHPVGWGFGRLNSMLRRQCISEEVLHIEHHCPVLFVHGIFHNSTAFYAIERNLRKNNFKNIQAIELWTSVDRIEAMADQLKARVDEVYRAHLASGKPGKVRIVAHSLGGVILRVALQDLDFASKIDKILFLGVPHQGNIMYRSPYPRCIRDLAPNTPLMRRIKERPLPGKIHYWNLRGTLDIVTTNKDTILPDVPNLYFDGVGHAGLLRAKRVLQAITAILETPLYDRIPSEVKRHA